MAKNTKKNILGKKIKIEFNYPNDLKSHFVSNLVVQHQPEFFILSFFEGWPPVILGDSEEEKRKALESIEKIEAKCVSRLVITPEKVKEFITAISQNYKNYEEKYKK